MNILPEFLNCKNIHFCFRDTVFQVPQEAAAFQKIFDVSRRLLLKNIIYFFAFFAARIFTQTAKLCALLWNVAHFLWQKNAASLPSTSRHLALQTYWVGKGIIQNCVLTILMLINMALDLIPLCTVNNSCHLSVSFLSWPETRRTPINSIVNQTSQIIKIVKTNSK